MEQDKIYLFTDGSVSPKSKIGYGSYIITKDLNLSLDVLKKQVNVVRFENTSSTKLEIQILLYVLENINEKNIIIYTDSKNIINLLNRRVKLEKNNFESKNRLIKNHDEYKKFFYFIDHLNLNIIKIKGHTPTNKKNNIDNIFSIVDKTARFTLRKDTLNI